MAKRYTAALGSTWPSPTNNQPTAVVAGWRSRPVLGPIRDGQTPTHYVTDPSPHDATARGRCCVSFRSGGVGQPCFSAGARGMWQEPTRSTLTPKGSRVALYNTCDRQLRAVRHSRDPGSLA